MTSSKPVYIASAEEDALPFAVDELLNRDVDQAFEEAAWRLADAEAVFEPLAIKTLTLDQLERMNRGEPWMPEPEVTEPEPVDEAALSLDPEAAEADDSLLTATSDLATDAPVMDLEWLETQRAEARAETEIALRVEYDGRIQALEEALTAKDQEHVEALASTERALREEAAREMDAAKQALIDLTTRVTEAANHVGHFFEPLSRLAIHVASQLVRGELTLHPTAIARLVQGCLDHLEGQIPARPPVLRLHPDDLAQYLSTLGGTLEGLELRADPAMARGDVSIQMNDSAIEDLIQHRLDQLVSVIFGTPQPWAQEVFQTPNDQAQWAESADWTPVDEEPSDSVVAEVDTSEPSQDAIQGQDIADPMRPGVIDPVQDDTP